MRVFWFVLFAIVAMIVFSIFYSWTVLRPKAINLDILREVTINSIAYWVALAMVAGLVGIVIWKRP